MLGDRARTLARLAVTTRVPIAAIAIAALAWPFLRTPAAGSLDPSWRLGLHMAAASGMRAGVDIVFTYGPLGFLSAPQPYTGFTTLLAILFSFAVYAALAAAILVAAARAVPFWAAALVTLVIARFFVDLPPFEALQALVFVLAVEAIRRGPSNHGYAFAAGFGVLGAVAILGKLNVGVFVIAVGALASVAIVRPAWKGAVAYVGAAIIGGLVLWIATGQRFADLVPFAAGAYQTIVGYSQAMITDRSTDQLWIYVAFAAIVGVLAWHAWDLSRSWSRFARVALLAVGLVMAFALWKTAFTRWFPVYTFATLLILSVALASQQLGRTVWLVSVLAAALALSGIARPTPTALANFPRSLLSLGSEARDALLPGRGPAAVDQTRTQLQAWYQLPPDLVAAVTGHRVHVDDWDAGLAFAYPGIAWDPLPVIQGYEVWTPAMDQLNVAKLQAADAPDRIVREYQVWTDPPDYVRAQLGRALRPGEVLPVTVDGRFRWFEEPAATLEIFCRYRQTLATDRWQVLERTASSCGAPQPMSTITAVVGAPVTVPTAPAGSFVIVRVHGLQPSLLGQVKAALWKGTEWFATIDGSGYRLVPGTVSDGLLMAVPSAADGSGPFAFGPQIRTLSIAPGLGKPTSHEMLTYEFLSVPSA
jgi:hypothetical protein